MCPIVPTFTCGLLRSNFSFARGADASGREVERGHGRRLLDLGGRRVVDSHCRPRDHARRFGKHRRQTGRARFGHGRQVADVRYGGPLARGDGSVNSKPAVILTVQKQPGADTLTLDRKIEATLDAIQATLPADVKIEQNIFKQANFITVAIKNVEEAIRDGARCGLWWCCSCFCGTFAPAPSRSRPFRCRSFSRCWCFTSSACRSTP